MIKRQSIHGRRKAFSDNLGSTAPRQSGRTITRMETPTTDLRHNKNELDLKRHRVGEVATEVQKQRSVAQGRRTRRRVLASPRQGEITQDFRVIRGKAALKATLKICSGFGCQWGREVVEPKPPFRNSIAFFIVWSGSKSATPSC